MASPSDSAPNGEALPLEERVERVLARAYGMARSHLEGINEAAEELAALAGEDRRVIERARRTAVERVTSRPDRDNLQVLSLIRRAIELGDRRWQWEETRPVP